MFKNKSKVKELRRYFYNLINLFYNLAKHGETSSLSMRAFDDNPVSFKEIFVQESCE